MSKPLVVFDKVVKRFDDFVAVKQMDLEIGQGEFVAIWALMCVRGTVVRIGVAF